MAVHVYRNRFDDHRGPADMHFCSACDGWYGAPHTNSHCRKGEIAAWLPEACACRFCREHTGQAICGPYGVITDAPEWQP